MTEPPPSFDRHGAAEPASPVVLSVPHAGRDYPLALRAALRVPVEALTPLEDRHVDTLALAARGAETLLIQRPPRAWIDLNRAEHERDPRIDDGADPAVEPIRSARLDSGLGLVPRRVAGAGDIWRRRFGAGEIAARIAADHRPYHAALATALAAARSRFGTAVLLDVHSMPSLGAGKPGIVIGDRLGRAAANRFVDRVEREIAAFGIAPARNAPYAGGHIIDRHGRPAAGVHAIQIEFDRALYLDPALDRPGEGLHRIAGLLRRMIDALADEVISHAALLAAE